MSSSNKGRHRARSRAARTGTRAGAVAAAVTSIAVVGGGTIPAAPASAAPFVLMQNCVGGSGQALSNVNCANSSASPTGSVIGGALPADLTAVLKLLKIDLNSSAVVLGSDGTATISGTGFALAAQALNVPLFGGVGGTSTANAVTPLSGAIAVGTGRGNASATAVSGLAVAASGSGTASAVSVGGVATAINILGVKNVTCTALYASASADGVGRCTSVLYVFTAKNAAGSDVWTFAVADPTSFSVGGDGALPIPHFTRDLIRVSVGGPSGPTVGSDLFSVPAVSKNAVALSSAAATGRTDSVAARSVPVPEATASSVVAPFDDIEQSPPESDDLPPAPVVTASTVGKHRSSDADSQAGFAVPTRPTSVATQPTSVATQPTGTTAQPAGTTAQPGSGGAAGAGQVADAP